MTTEPYFVLEQTGASSWSAVLVQDGKRVGQMSGTATEEQPQLHPSVESMEWSGRFPRLALALVALMIFAASVTAEIEYLRQTGHLFR